MAFWTDGDKLNAKDPKRNFRWKVEIGGIAVASNAIDSESVESLVWWAKKVQKPNFTTAESKHVFLGHSYYWPGKTEWQEITMTLVDPVTPGATAHFYKMTQDAGYTIPGTTGGSLKTQSKSKSVQALQSFVISQLDADGNSIETWTLKNPFIKKISFSDLDYENDDLTTIDLSIRYDWATCLTGDNASDVPFFDQSGTKAYN
jgi:hypothetical protein